MPLPLKILLGLGALLAAAACSTEDPGENPSIAGIPALLTGDYVGTSSRGPVYHSIAQLNVPEFGGEVFYHHISTTSLRGPAAQRKIYTFDESGQRMRSTVLLDMGTGFGDAQSMALELSQLAEESLLRFPESCQFQWSLAAGGFTAEVKRATCRYESPAFGGRVSPEMTYQLSRCGLVISEGIYREDGSPVFPPSTIDNRRVASKAGDC